MPRLRLSEAPVETVHGRDDREFGIREISPSDRDRLAAFVAGLSPETRYKRFLHSVRQLSEKELTDFTNLDHRDADAIVAVDARGELIGVARYGHDSDDREVAEVAVTVADEWQGRGVGTILLRRLATAAAAAGVRRFAASCFADNAEMLKLFDELGTTRRTGFCGGVVELEIALPNLTDEGDPGGSAAE